MNCLVGGFRISGIISRYLKIVTCRKSLPKYLPKSVRSFCKRNTLCRFLTTCIQSIAIVWMHSTYKLTSCYCSTYSLLNVYWYVQEVEIKFYKLKCPHKVGLKLLKMSHRSEGCAILINFVKKVWTDNERNEKQIRLFRNIKDLKWISVIDCYLFVFSMNRPNGWRVHHCWRVDCFPTSLCWGPGLQSPRGYRLC